MPYCFDIGGTNIRFGMPVSGGDVPVIAALATPAHSLPDFVEAVSKLIRENGDGVQDNIAISLTGVVHPQTNKVRVANVPAINGVDIASELLKKTGLPTVVANDADCLALAEAKVGVAQGLRNVFALVLGTGVGGGIVVDGQIIAGANGAAGELGHGPVVDPTANGKTKSLGYFDCGCGQKGCLDTVGGARGLEKIHEKIWGEQMRSDQIVIAAGRGDNACTATIDIWSEMVAGPLAMVVNVLGPELVPVGGGLANAPELIEVLDAKVRTRILFPTDKPLLVPAKFAMNAGLVGAAHLTAPQIRGVA